MAQTAYRLSCIKTAKSEVCRELLFDLLKKIWDKEDVPVSFARATFTMLYKNKGSPNDPTKYRCIGLLTHAYKVLAQCLLARLERITSLIGKQVFARKEAAEIMC